MDFDIPLRAHAEWLVALRLYIDGVGDLDFDASGRDDRCELGHWIYGEGACLAHCPEYVEARDVHATFHRHAAYVVELVRSGRQQAAEAQLDPDGELRALSNALVRAFAKLGRRIAADEEAKGRSGTDADSPASA